MQWLMAQRKLSFQSDSSRDHPIDHLRNAQSKRVYNLNTCDSSLPVRMNLPHTQ